MPEVLEFEDALNKKEKVKPQEKVPERRTSSKIEKKSGKRATKLNKGTIQWVQCEDCDTWRKVPDGVKIKPNSSFKCGALRRRKCHTK